MKKKLLLLFICMLTLLFVTGCDFTKKAITTDQFKKIAESKGLYAVDVKEQFKDFSFIKEATVAASQEGWQIEFYVLSDKDQAKSMYNKNLKTFQDYKGNGSKELKTEIGNYNKYTLETKDYYRLLTRVDSTFLYVEVPVVVKDKVNDVIDELGY